MKHNFQDWLAEKISDDREVILAGKLEYLRLYLTDAMRELRSLAGLTQAQLAEKLGVQQAEVSQLESALNDRNLESVLEYLHALDADLLIAIKQGDELYQVSDNEGLVLVDVPEEVQQLASDRGMSLSKYVRTMIQQLDRKTVSAIEYFLASDDETAMKVRKRLKSKSIPEIAAELEKCYSIAEVDDRTYTVKYLLSGRVAGGGYDRDEGGDDGDEEIELLDLAEELLEKLDIFLS